MPIFEALKPDGRVRLRARRPGRRRPLRQDGPQRHRVRPDAGLRRGLRAAARPPSSSPTCPASSSAGARAPSSGPGCSTCWTGRSTRTRTWPSCAATPRTPARAGGPSRRRSASPCRCTSSPPSLFARFASRQDDSPAMKAVAALRNQFGGHAVKQRADRRRRMYVRRLELTRLPLLRRRSGVELEPGPSVLVGPNGVGKTNLVEALGLRGHAGQPPGRHRRAAGAGRRERGGDPVRDRARRPRAAGRAGDRAGQGQPGPARAGRRCRRARDVLGALRLVLFAPEDLALVRGDPAERRRYLDDLLVPGSPGYAGVRADYERVLKQRNALLRTAYLARKVGGGARRRPVAPSTSGTPTWPSTAPSCSPAGSSLVAALAPARGQGVRRGQRRRGRGRDRLRRLARRRRADRLRPGRRWRRRCSPRWPGRGRARSSAGVTLVGPHRDDLVLTPRRPAGQGVRQPRRVLVVRAGAAAGRVRAAARRRRSSRCWCSTTSSPSWTPAAASGWPSWSAGAEQVLVTCAVAEDVPAALRGARYDVAEGEVRRVR